MSQFIISFYFYLNCSHLVTIRETETAVTVIFLLKQQNNQMLSRDQTEVVINMIKQLSQSDQMPSNPGKKFSLITSSEFSVGFVVAAIIFVIVFLFLSFLQYKLLLGKNLSTV